MEHELFVARITAVNDAFESEADHVGVLATALVDEISSEAIVEGEQIGWALFYQVKILHHGERWRELVDLMTSRGAFLVGAGSVNHSYTCSLTMESSFHLGEAEGVAHWALEACRIRVQEDREAFAMARDSALNLLEELGADDLAATFAEETNQLSIPPVPDYRLYDEASDSDLRDAISEHDPREPLTIGEFTVFSAVVMNDFKNVCYESYDRGGLMFWITDKHAKQIGKALSGRSLEGLMLCLTRFENDDGFDRVIENAGGSTIDTLTISHKTADEETAASMKAIARAAHHFSCRRLVVWCSEYESDAVEALGNELLRLDNRRVREFDICDTSLPEPDDVLSHPTLEAIVAKNSS